MDVRYLGVILLLQQAVAVPLRAAPVPVVGVMVGGPVPGTNLPELVKKADVIVAARITAGRDGQRPEVRIDTAIKSNSIKDLAEAVTSLEHNFGGQYNKYGIFFLRRAPAGLDLILASGGKSLSYVEAAPPNYALKTPSDDALTVVVSRVVSVFVIPVRVVADPKFGLAIDGMTIVDYSQSEGEASDHDPQAHGASAIERADDVFQSALSAIESVPGNVGGPFLASVIDGKSDSLGREFALAALTTYGDLSRLEKMQDYLLTPPAGARLAQVELGISLEAAELGPEQEAFLLALTRSTSNELRMTAYHKLADFKSDASIRMLAVGLDDRDAQVRQAAARAICDRTKVCDGEANHFTQREDLRKMQRDLTDLLSRIEH